MSDARRTAGLERREVLAGLVALPVVALGGCGESRAGPPLASLTVPTVRVRLGAPRASAALRLPAGGWDMLGEAGRSFSLRQPSTLAATLSVGESGIALAGRDTGATTLTVRSAGPFGLDGGVYAGSLRVRREGALLLFVNEVDLETYTAGVIPNESAPAAAPATHRAQAVASRTYAYVAVTDPATRNAAFHLKDTQASQVYRGFVVAPTFGASATDMLQRCAETRGVVLTWQSRPFTTYFASTCGGHTTDPSTSSLKADALADPLRGVPCTYCSTSSRFRWTKRISDDELIAGMAAVKLPIAAPVESIEVSATGRGGWARELVVTAGPARARRTIPGTAFRTAAGLDSHNLRGIRRVDGGFEIAGSGWGHGVGMCQWGAFEMGKRGFSETDMLRAYYPGVAFARMY